MTQASLKVAMPGRQTLINGQYGDTKKYRPRGFMVIKKVPPKAVVVLSFEEHHRVEQVVALLVAVDQRAGARNVKVRCVSDNKRKSSEERGTRLKQKQKNKFRKICGPCFLFQTLYSETGNCKLKNPLPHPSIRFILQ